MNYNNSKIIKLLVKKVKCMQKNGPLDKEKIKFKKK